MQESSQEMMGNGLGAAPNKFGNGAEARNNSLAPGLGAGAGFCNGVEARHNSLANNLGAGAGGSGLAGFSQ